MSTRQPQRLPPTSAPGEFRIQDRNCQYVIVVIIKQPGKTSYIVHTPLRPSEDHQQPGSFPEQASVGTRSIGLFKKRQDVAVTA